MKETGCNFLRGFWNPRTGRWLADNHEKILGNPGILFLHNISVDESALFKIVESACIPLESSRGGRMAQAMRAMSLVH